MGRLTTQFNGVEIDLGKWTKLSHARGDREVLARTCGSKAFRRRLRGCSKRYG